MSTQDLTPYEEVRKRLVERGYLSGPVERFVLFPSVQARSAVGGVLRASARGAALGAPLLATLVTLALAWTQRPLLAASDLPLLWLYVTIPAAGVLFVLQFGVALGAGALTRRTPSAARARLLAARGVGLLVLVYALALWWSAPRAQTRLEDLAFVGLLVPVSLAIGELSGLVSLAAILRRPGELPARGRRSRARLLFFGLFVVAGVLAARGFLRSEASAQGVDFAVVSGRPPIFVVGIDGLDGDLLAELDARGAVPLLLGLAERGAVFPLRFEGGAEPAEAWTTIATGMPTRSHGVAGAEADWLPGVRTPVSRDVPLWSLLRLLLPERTRAVSGAERRVPALWEIVGRKEPSVVVGWWASWPAPQDAAPRPGSGVVTDRALPKLVAGIEPDRDTWPPELFAELRARFPEDQRAIEGELADDPDEGAETEIGAWFRESFHIDAYSALVFGRLAAHPEVRAAFLYLPGFEILRHRLGTEGHEARSPLPVAEALERYGRFLDQTLGSIAELARDGILLIIATPARRSGVGAEGFLAIVGPGPAAGCVGRPLDAQDVAPLVLRLAGFPVSSEMPGRSAEGCRLSDLPDTGSVTTFGRLPETAGGAGSDYDDELVERLRSLGYLR